MLVELAVENYAVIEAVRVRFHAGLNLLTGETGSGKSIVVDALGLLLGGRASSDMVRTGEARARVSGIFEVSPSGELNTLLESAGVELEDGELLIEREIQASGKSRAFVANRPATAQLLRDLAPHLADIHGQHDQQQLFSSEVQCEMLDGFAAVDSLIGQVAEAFWQWRHTNAELEELDRTSQEKLRLADLWQHQRAEIEAVSPKPAEDQELEAERRVLRNVVRLEELAQQALGALYEDEGSVSVQAAMAGKRLSELSEIDPGAREILTTLQPALLAIDEASHALRHYVGKLEADPGRLDEIETRLAAIEKLKRKYGASVEEIATFLEEVRDNLSAVENSDERRKNLRKQAADLANDYASAAARLTAKRTDAARQLGKRVEAELASLSMEKTRIEIRVSPAEWSSHGCDRIEFLIAPNQGEELKPLDKIASGGELSRVALALKTCTSAAPAIARKSVGKQGPVPRTLVFDEVDAGVGGSAAEAVGKRLKKLSASNQVLCVTHLPQIAGFADHHYSVEKHSEQGRTIASITELTGAARTREIGRMLSGERITPEALRHAEQLLKTAAL